MSLQEIFEKILSDLGLSIGEIQVITTMIPEPGQMAMLVDYIEQSGYAPSPDELIEEATQIMIRTGGGIAVQ